jgi:hypothetical protein
VSIIPTLPFSESFDFRFIVGGLPPVAKRSEATVNLAPSAAFALRAVPFIWFAAMPQKRSRKAKQVHLFQPVHLVSFI